MECGDDRKGEGGEWKGFDAETMHTSQNVGSAYIVGGREVFGPYVADVRAPAKPLIYFRFAKKRTRGLVCRQIHDLVEWLTTFRQLGPTYACDLRPVSARIGDGLLSPLGFSVPNNDMHRWEHVHEIESLKL